VSEGLPERVTLHQIQGSADPQGFSALPRRLMASWQRSEDYGISLEAVKPVFMGTERAGADDDLFVQCGNEVLSDLHRTLAGEPVSMMLTDADGVVLSRLSGDRQLLAALDEVYLAPGFGYAERDVGTNGLGLALADRVATLVRADQHYAQNLNAFTCAAVPVLDPDTGRLEGSVNLTTWSHTSSGLLLALARSAASSTTALMLARSGGRRPRPTPRGQVFRVEVPQLEPASGTLHSLSTAWSSALAAAGRAMSSGQIVLAVGEAGAGRATLLGQAARQTYPRDRILSAGAPSPDDVQTWLGLWTPELGKAHTAIIVRDVDLLPEWVAERLRDLVLRGAMDSAGDARVPFAVTAERFADIPTALASLVDTVIEVAPLRDRPDDVLPLAAHIARRARGRDVHFSPAASRALRNFGWPGNVDQLHQIVTRAASRADVIDVANLPTEVLAGNGRHLSRIEAFERGEIVRVLGTGSPTMAEAAHELGMSRATLYRKISQYGIDVPR
jgi:sigma-54 dependent transcriptional regulator, acetoin dehydrogenase operon transcriptional activator AcoR